MEAKPLLLLSERSYSTHVRVIPRHRDVSRRRQSTTFRSDSGLDGATARLDEAPPLKYKPPLLTRWLLSICTCVCVSIVVGVWFQSFVPGKWTDTRLGRILMDFRLGTVQLFFTLPTPQKHGTMETARTICSTGYARWRQSPLSRTERNHAHAKCPINRRA